MSDSVVDRLNEALEGRYRIERELGEGGMATVYLAHDVRHERRVAIKVLRPELAAVVGAERFLAEIRTTAQLQHPHILTLHDSGEADGFLFYVMPYVQGESLRERLARERQLPVGEAAALARKVADALDYAHERGVVHRDVKPANVLLSERGEPLVADFGIALAVSEAGEGRITETGLSLGTPHYMSPEQASGDQSVDRRTDVYALGCVLHEMLVGEPPHGGSTAQAVLARILTGEPQRVRDVRPTVPPNVDAAVAKSLEKLPADRFGGAGAFAEALEDSGFRYTRSEADTPETVEQYGTPPSRRWGTLAGLGAAAVLALAAFLVGRSTAPQPESEGASTVVRVPLDTTEYGIHRAVNFRISPDGTRLVHMRPLSGFMIVDLATGEERALPGTENLHLVPVFSPDGDEIAAVDRNGGFRRIRLDGSEPLPMGPESAVLLVAHVWTEHYLYYSTTEGAYRWSGDDAEPELLLPEGFFQASDFRPLPGEELVLYTAQTAFTEEAEVRLLDVRTGETRGLVPDGISGRYLPGGYLLWGRFDGSVLAAPFDPESGALGESVRVLSDVDLDADFGALKLSVSETGTLVYRTGEGGDDTGERVVRVDPDGRIRPTTIGARYLSDPAVSPDGQHLAVVRNGRVVVIDLVTGEELTTPPDLIGVVPRWAPDGTQLSFAGLARSAGRDVQVGAAHVWSPFEGAEPMRLETEYGETVPTGWTPDGSRLVGYVADADGGWDIAVVDPEGGNVEIYLGAPRPEHGPRLSPDGRWLAYHTGQSGFDLFLRSFPDPGPALQLDRPGESPAEFVWDPGGTTIYYLTDDSLHAVDLDLGSTPRIAGRRALFGLDRPEGRLASPGGMAHSPETGGITHHPQGGFVMILEPTVDSGEQEEAPPRTWLVVNWFEELRARMEGGQ